MPYDVTTERWDFAVSIERAANEQFWMAGPSLPNNNNNNRWRYYQRATQNPVRWAECAPQAPKSSENTDFSPKIAIS